MEVEKDISVGPDTRDRILDAAEILFADQGFAEISLRQITTHAEVNLAAVNYYFGSKDGLIFEVLARVVGPINERRLAMLDEAESKANGQPVEVERILEALFLPVVSVMNQSDHSGQVVLKLAGRCMSETNAEMPDKIQRIFQELANRFSNALAYALPQLSEAEVFWRIHFTIGAMLYSLVQHETLVLLSEGKVAVDDAEKAMGELVAFTAGGLRAENASHEKVNQPAVESDEKGGGV